MWLVRSAKKIKNGKTRTKTKITGLRERMKDYENTFEERDVGGKMEPARFTGELPTYFIVHWQDKEVNKLLSAL